jgi:cytochrome c556
MTAMRKPLINTLSLLLCLASVTADAHMPYEQALEAQTLRQSVFELLSFNVETLALMSRGVIDFDEEVAVRNAERIGVLAPIITELFAADTRNTGIKTRAKDIIWDNWDTFVERRLDLERAAKGMQEAARGGDRASMARAMRPIGQACGACHDMFRFLPNDPALVSARQ